MALSRKRQKELNRLKRSAEELWDEQRGALDHASTILKDARRQAANYAREEVAPRARDTYDSRVRPAVASVAASGRSAASRAGERLSDDLLPAISGAIGSALAMVEVAKDPRLRAALKQATSAANSVGAKVGRTVHIAEPPKKSGPGKYILISLGAIAAVGVLYAAWQTLRADDDLWIEDLGDPGEGDVRDTDDGDSQPAAE
ncbi:hypothetical protein BH10ACT6_BH10ACT6_14050 [soil metagenome]